MTVSSSSSANHHQVAAGARLRPSSQSQVQQTAISSCQTGTSSGGFNPSAAFQQVKQTQSSMARLIRVHQQLQCQTSPNSSHQQTSSQHQNQVTKELNINQMSINQHQHQHHHHQQQSIAATPPKTTSFVDCLIRRFKNCFSEDFCTVPMFVVGNLSPGSDGTHLILPPCVSLGGQNISRFSSPKNLRHMISIRESCRSIEELDLGGSKLNDLIEVYKILQCTPNLKLLNLSGNDLSRASPVAMANSYSTSSASTSSAGAIILPVLSSITPQAPGQHHLATSNNITWTPMGVNTSAGSRNYLAPINQNQQSSALASRRHSTLGTQPTLQVSNTSRNRSSAMRIADARRHAAANALAQSKKTSSSMASKLTDSANVYHGSRSNARVNSRCNGSQMSSSASCQSMRPHAIGVHSQASTMHLARSLSSLSSKDVRAATSSRLSTVHHRASERKTDLSSTTRLCRDSNTKPNSSTITNRRSSPTGSKSNQSDAQPTASSKQLNSPLVNKERKFEAEPIVETEADTDVDMTTGEHQQQTISTGNDFLRPSSGVISNQSNSSRPASQAKYSGNNNTIKSSSLNSNTSISNPLNQQQQTTFKRTFDSIKALALNNTGCPWKVVCSILQRMPNLEDLHLSLNNYQKIDLEPSEFRHLSLKRLYLCNNPRLTNWEELNKLLIAFPSLEALSIADCNISQIPENLSSLNEWKKLCGLNINGWPIKEWPIIERLNQLPSLTDLKCRNLEIFNSVEEPRHHLIARLPKLKRLNGSEIYEEREYAEKAFLKFFLANSHLERPRRFDELIKVHGEMELLSPVDVDVDLSPPSQAYIKVVHINRQYFTRENEDDILMSEDFFLKLMTQDTDSNDDENKANNMELESTQSDSTGPSKDKQPTRLFKDETQEVVAIKVDLRQSVRKFKSIIAEIFGLSSQNLILYYIDHEMVGLMGPELIKHNQKKLWNYNVQDGDQFIVEEI